MSRTLTAADRSRLIRLASTMEKGSEERKAILAGLSKSAATRYEHNGELKTLAQLAREAIGKDVFLDSRGRSNYNILMDRSGDSASVFKVSPSQWKKLRLPDLTPPRIQEKVLDMHLTKLKKKLSMSDGIDFNMWARDTNPTKEEMVAWLERRV